MIRNARHRRRFRFIVVCATFIATVTSTCTHEKRDQTEQSIVAAIDDEVITKQHFENQLAREVQSLLGERWTPEQVEPFKRPLLDSLIDQILIARAAKKAGIEVSADEINRRITSMKHPYPSDTFENELIKTQTSLSALEQMVRQELLFNKYLEAEIFSRLAVSNEAIDLAYGDAGTKWDEPEQVRVLHIVVREIDLLKRIARELASGKKFPDLARRYSESPEAQTGGDLGFFPRGQMPAVFDDVVFRLRPGQTSEIVTSEFGFHLFRVVDRRPTRKRALREVRSRIEKEQLSILRAQAQDELIRTLRNAARININAEVLASLSPKPPPSSVRGEPATEHGQNKNESSL